MHFISLLLYTFHFLVYVYKCEMKNVVPIFVVHTHRTHQENCIDAGPLTVGCGKILQYMMQKYYFTILEDDMCSKRTISAGFMLLHTLVE